MAYKSHLVRSSLRGNSLRKCNGGLDCHRRTRSLGSLARCHRHFGVGSVALGAPDMSDARRATRSVAAAHPGVTVPHEWTRRGRWWCVIAIIAIRVIGPGCDCAPDDSAGYDPGRHSAPKRTGPTSPPRIRRAQRRPCCRADDYRRDQNVPNLSHIFTPNLLSKQSHITVYT
jgi:hypothetical protein